MVVAPMGERAKRPCEGEEESQDCTFWNREKKICKLHQERSALYGLMDCVINFTAEEMVSVVDEYNGMHLLDEMMK